LSNGIVFIFANAKIQLIKKQYFAVVFDSNLMEVYDIFHKIPMTLLFSV